MMTTMPDYVAFDHDRLIAQGALAEVAAAARARVIAVPDARLLAFDARTSEPVEIDTRERVDALLARMAPMAGAAATGSGETENVADAETPPRRGRPKLGVVAREVTLLPRHWDWLAAQSGGASVALRKLVERARRESAALDARRAAQTSCFRFMSAMAGDLPGYEEATRALFATDGDRFAELIASWPPDIRRHLESLAKPAFVPVPAEDAYRA